MRSRRREVLAWFTASLAIVALASVVAAVGPCTTLGTRTSVLGLCKPAQGEVNWTDALNGNFDTLDALFQTPGVLKPSAGGFGFNAGNATNGQLPIGNGTGFTLANLTAGVGIAVTNSAGGITIASSGSPAGGSISAAGTLEGSGSGSDYTRTTGTFADVDATNLKATVSVPTGAKFLIVQGTLCTPGTSATDGNNRVQVLAAGSAIAPAVYANNGSLNPAGQYSIYGVVANPPSGSQTIALQFRGDGANAFVIKNQAIEGTLGGPIPVCKVRMLYTVTN